MTDDLQPPVKRRFCAICGARIHGGDLCLNGAFDHRCGGTSSYCGNCGEHKSEHSNLPHVCKQETPSEK